VARPSSLINPVDLGTVLVPHDWLLLTDHQDTQLEVAAISRLKSFPTARIRAWFDEGNQVSTPLPLHMNRRAATLLTLPLPPTGERSKLHVAIDESGEELWHTEIETMIVTKRPRWPAFGAVETKLRYDAPISVKERSTGRYTTLDYERGWDPRLKDVVVFMPNGSRFVFWRGASYVPFWAGSYNTGLTYQWAETIPPPGFVDCVEPLQDKELRFGRVSIVETTESRVHIRWTYESVDVDYRTLGDSAAEDFYFYPDGFGTRVLTLTSSPRADYEITEFITLLPQSAYPFDVLPSRLLEILYLNGEKETIDFPYRASPGEKDFGLLTQQTEPKSTPRIYKLFSEKRDPLAAIYFSPLDIPVVRQTFKPFYDRGEIVTPGYWGNHWPLGRGAPTGGTIDERITSSPAHISTFGWGLWSGGNRPKPLATALSKTLDAHGRMRQMLTQRWAWLIAKTDAPDGQLLNWAKSYTAPPSLTLEGARLAHPSYSAERRAMRLIAETHRIRVELRPEYQTMNPVFEIEGAPSRLLSVNIDSQDLPPGAYAWDGRTLWIQRSIGSGGSAITLQFASR
jgi:hypothetical protein